MNRVLPVVECIQGKATIACIIDSDTFVAICILLGYQALDRGIDINFPCAGALSMTCQKCEYRHDKGFCHDQIPPNSCKDRAHHFSLGSSAPSSKMEPPLFKSSLKDTL